MSIVSLSGFTSFGIGGEADVYYLTREDELNQLLTGDYIILGRGTNVLVSDSGVKEKVIVNKLNIVTFDGETVYAQSGVSIIALCALCAERGLSGLEWACGVPGSVGGAVIMNAGAYGGCIADSIVFVDCFRDGSLITLNRPDCGFGYRSSGFVKGDFVYGAKLKLAKKDTAQILADMRKLAIKREQNQPKGRSAGSVFMRDEKPAGWYIEQAGLKGASVGGAQVSTKHANFIINSGSASAKDVLTLIEYIQDEVEKKFQVRLKREIKLIGDF